jgi:hypothetical protein
MQKLVQENNLGSSQTQFKMPRLAEKIRYGEFFRK